MAVRLALAQVNPTVGDLAGNRRLVESQIEEAGERGAAAVLFPELVLTGYPPEDLLQSRSFVDDTREALERLIPATAGILAVVGCPLVLDEHLRNAAVVLLDARWADTYAKGSLPNYGVFDEKRYFRPGLRCPVYHWGTLPFGVNICEDLWTPRGVPSVQARSGARWLWNLSSSPYHAGKGQEREALLRRRSRTHGVAIAYANLVGAQDELVFDGESLFVDARGTIRARAPQFRESLLVIEVDENWLGDGRGIRDHDPEANRGEGDAGGCDRNRGTGPDGAGGDSKIHGRLEPPSGPPPRSDAQIEAAKPSETDLEPEAEPIDEIADRFYPVEVHLSPGPPGAGPAAPPDAPASYLAPRLAAEAEIYQALVLGLSDYLRKNGFREVVLGLSGGIDSALTATIAADALGPDCVTGVSMPSRYNSPSSRQGAADLARNLGIRFLEIPIERVNRAFLETLAPAFAGRNPDVTEENIQARIRGTLLMALSNKTGALVLATGNKSELAVGYCTLYGDMVGGFAVIKDVPKTLVYRLARYRNASGAVIPEDTLARAPSAELREDQRDTDTLPPYEILDAIVEARMEAEEDPDILVARGFDRDTVEQVYRWIDGNEYKRGQAPPGIRITPRAFGKDRRYPITNRYVWR